MADVSAKKEKIPIEGSQRRDQQTASAPLESDGSESSNGGSPMQPTESDDERKKRFIYYWQPPYARRQKHFGKWLSKADLVGKADFKKRVAQVKAGKFSQLVDYAKVPK
ncbi:hypothetical protein JTE90_024286 [Oedothorax gibbosus]|uniref:Uncharacterized protein n=1 Tax=Oedothorax gibbosus TaxID=931172 RepID=A0AAV6VZG2_9ARAC|nr:hypothetical protein JTE90_024286 [Oedothorax gibbosus]